MSCEREARVPLRLWNRFVRVLPATCQEKGLSYCDARYGRVSAHTHGARFSVRSSKRMSTGAHAGSGRYGSGTRTHWLRPACRVMSAQRVLYYRLVPLMLRSRRVPGSSA